MIAWRLSITRRREVAFAGEGARRYGGRWNPVGIPIVYAATTPSLAALEVLGHVDPEEARQYWRFRIEVPEEQIERVDLQKLPRGWNAGRPRVTTARIGGEWARSLRTAALLVPSVHVPTGEELNVLLNPRHPAFETLVIEAPVAYSFDARVLPR